MKKIIILGTIISMISSNNASGMLLKCLRSAPQQTHRTRQRTIHLLQAKNIFNTEETLPKTETYGQLNDLFDRNNSAITKLEKIINCMEKQNDLAVSHTFHDEELNKQELVELEQSWQKTLNELTDIHKTKE
jgi:hypothetical protein